MKWRIAVLGSGNQSKKISRKWFAVGAGSLLLVVMIPSVLLLAKIATGLVIVPFVAIAIKVALKAISEVLEDKREDQGQAARQTMQSRIIGLAVGLLSMFAGGLSLFTIAQVGLAATCAAVAALVLYGYFKAEEIGEVISDKLDEIAENTTDFIVSNVEKLLPQQSCKM